MRTQFKSFSERISGLRVDVFHKVRLALPPAFSRSLDRRRAEHACLALLSFSAH